MNTEGKTGFQHEEEDVFSIKEFISLCLRQWKWFLASLIFFGGISFFYLAKQQPQYDRSIEILIKDNEGGGLSDMASGFSLTGLFSNNTSVYNELISFTSPAVMFEVVDRLNLTISYTKRMALKSQTLYESNNPVEVTFEDFTDKDGGSMQLELSPDGTYVIRKIRKFDVTGIVKYKDEVTGKLNGAASGTPLGKISVKANPAYTGMDKPDENIVIDVVKQSRQSAVENYLTKLKGDLVDQDAEVIKLSIVDASVERADNILDMVVEVYNERWIEDKNKMAKATSVFISERLGMIEKELNQVEENIADQKSALQIPDIEQMAKGYIEQDFRMNEEYLKVSNMLAMSIFLRDYLKDPANTFSILPMNTGTENSVLEQQINNYNEILLQRNNLAENSSPENPLVKDMDKQLAGLRTAVIRSVDSHISNLENTLKNIAGAQTQTKEKLSSSPQTAMSLLSKERQQLVTQQLYIFLLEKREENELTQAFTADNTRIITPPYGKQKPVSPKRGLTIVIAFFMGLVIPAVSMFLAEASNTKIRSKKDLESMPIPFAGEIPQLGKRNRLKKLLMTKKGKQREIDKPHIVVREGMRDVPNEAFRVIRSNIDFMVERGTSPVLALTSFNPGSGKSFIAFNLGASFALKNKRVLLVDGDLRHGSISKYVDSPKKGISNYLAGDSDNWQQYVIKDNHVKGLDVMPIGHRPPNPAELLDSPKLGKMIEEAKREYDVVIVDCPPVNIVVDTQIINQHATRTLFVVRAGLLEKKGLRDLQNIVETKKLINLTLILNDTKSEVSSYHTYGNYEAFE